MNLPNIIWNLAGGITNYFQGTNDSIYCFIVHTKSFVIRALHERERLFGVLQHIIQVIFVFTLPTGIASRRICCPILRLSESFITRSTFTPRRLER